MPIRLTNIEKSNKKNIIAAQTKVMLPKAAAEDEQKHNVASLCGTQTHAEWKATAGKQKRQRLM